MKKYGIILAAILLFVVTLGVAFSAGTPTKPLEVTLDRSNLIDSKNNTISASFNDYLKGLGFETYLENGKNKVKLKEDTKLYTFTAFSAIDKGGYLCALDYRDQSVDPADCTKGVHRYDSIILKEDDGSTYEITLKDFIEAYPIIASGSVRILVNGKETDGGVFTTNEVLSSFWTGCTEEYGKKICLFISGDEDSDNSLSINHLWISIQGEKELATCPAPSTPTVTTVTTSGSTVTKTETGEVVPPECVVPDEPNCKTFGHCMSFLDMKIANEIFLNKGKPSQVMKVGEVTSGAGKTITVDGANYTLKDGKWYFGSLPMEKTEYAIGTGWVDGTKEVIFEYNLNPDTDKKVAPYYFADGKWYNSSLVEQKNVYYFVEIAGSQTPNLWMDAGTNRVLGFDELDKDNFQDKLIQNLHSYSGALNQFETASIRLEIGTFDSGYKTGVTFAN